MKSAVAITLINHKSRKPMKSLYTYIFGLGPTKGNRNFK